MNTAAAQILPRKYRRLNDFTTSACGEYVTVSLFGLGGGHTTRVRTSHWEQVRRFAWYACRNNRSGSIYATSNVLRNGKWATVTMQSVLLGTTTGRDSKFVGDHHGDGNDTLNNVVGEGLRLRSRSFNSARAERKAPKSGFHGVRWDEEDQRFHATCRRQYLSSHLTAEDAARAYDRAVLELYPLDEAMELVNFQGSYKAGQ